MWEERLTAFIDAHLKHGRVIQQWGKSLGTRLLCDECCADIMGFTHADITPAVQARLDELEDLFGDAPQTHEEQRNQVKAAIFGLHRNDAHTLLETAGEWIDVNFENASEQALTLFMDCFADHVLAGRPLGQTVSDLLDDLMWGDFNEDLLDDAAERATLDVAGQGKKEQNK
jgi:hypothetical protein